MTKDEIKEEMRGILSSALLEKPYDQLHGVDVSIIELIIAKLDRAGLIPGSECKCEALMVQLAGCGAAALGATRDPAVRGDWGWSGSYQDVLDLRNKYDKVIIGLGTTYYQCEVCGQTRNGRLCPTCRITELEAEVKELKL